MIIIRRFLRGESGATSIEYALVAGIVSLVIVSGVTSIGMKLRNHYFAPIAANLS